MVDGNVEVRKRRISSSTLMPCFCSTAAKAREIRAGFVAAFAAGVAFPEVPAELRFAARARTLAAMLAAVCKRNAGEVQIVGARFPTVPEQRTDRRQRSSMLNGCTLAEVLARQEPTGTGTKSLIDGAVQ
jgi:hypothetical protein